MIKYFMIFISIIFSRKNNTSNVRLEKQVPKSPIDEFCNRIAPYLILSFILILFIFLFIALLRYGHSITGTEANGYYYHLEG